MYHDQMDGTGVNSHSQIDNVISEFVTDGVYGTPLLSDTAWDDMLVLPDQVKLPASSAPAYAAYDTDLQVLTFAAAGGEYAYFTVQIPHRYKAGTDLKFHAHFMPFSANMTNGQTVTFRCHCKFAARGIAFQGGGVFVDADSTYTSSGTTTSAIHCVGNSATISGTTLTESGILICRLERLSADTFGTAVALLGVDFHYEVEKFGTASEWA